MELPLEDEHIVMFKIGKYVCLPDLFLDKNVIICSYKFIQELKEMVDSYESKNSEETKKNKHQSKRRLQSS